MGTTGHQASRNEPKDEGQTWESGDGVFLRAANEMLQEVTTMSAATCFTYT